MRRLLLIACAVSVLAPLAGHAQELRLDGRVDATTAAAVSTLVDSARALQLPTEPLVLKALEGASKGASSAAIVAATRNLLHALAAARSALEVTNPSALQLGAVALASGATPQQLAQLGAHNTQPALESALAGVVYLLSRGVNADESARIVASMLAAGLSAGQFTSLQRLVDQDLRSGATASDAAQVRARALIRYGARLGPRGERE